MIHRYRQWQDVASESGQNLRCRAFTPLRSYAPQVKKIELRPAAIAYKRVKGEADHQTFVGLANNTENTLAYSSSLIVMLNPRLTAEHSQLTHCIPSGFFGRLAGSSVGKRLRTAFRL